MTHDNLLERPRKATAKDVEYIGEFRKWILAHLDMPHTLETLAMQAGFSISKMQRLFRRVFDVSVISFIRYERLVRAKGQIEVTDMSIKTIAAEAGYKSLPAFTSAFSEAFQTTPAYLRKQTRIKS